MNPKLFIISLGIKLSLISSPPERAFFPTGVNTKFSGFVSYTFTSTKFNFNFVNPVITILFISIGSTTEDGIVHIFTLWFRAFPTYISIKYCVSLSSFDKDTEILLPKLPPYFSTILNCFVPAVPSSALFVE